MAEAEDAGGALFRELDALLDADPHIDEMGLVVSTAPFSGDSGGADDADARGRPFVLVDHKLGVAFWAVKPLFRWLVAAFRAARAQPQPQSAHVLRVTRALVLVQADDAGAWAARKLALLEARDVDAALEAELRLLTLVVSKHPKSGEAWAHRRWAALRLQPAATWAWTDAHCRRELAAARSAAAAYPHNYYAWQHRLWLSQRLGTLEDLQAELSDLTMWTDTHVSEYCGFHHRQTVIQRMRALVSAQVWVELLRAEMVYTDDMIDRYPGHEVMWMHRR